MLETQRVSYSAEDVCILNNISFSMPPRGVLHLQGNNGSGKTTLLHLLCGLKQPESGSILFDNVSIYEHLSHYQSQINYIGHQAFLHNHLTITEHWQLFNVNNALFSKAIDLFQLESCLQLPAYKLSMGQRKKAVLIGLMIHTKLIWILDEPFSSLDQSSIDKLIDLMSDHAKQGGIVVVTSHQPLPNLDCEVKRVNL